MLHIAIRRAHDLVIFGNYFNHKNKSIVNGYLVLLLMAAIASVGVQLWPAGVGFAAVR